MTSSKSKSEAPSASDRRAALVAYSEARASRRDVAAAFGEEVSFGRLLRLLAAENLPLPIHRSAQESLGRVLLRKAIAAHAADA